MGTGKRESAFQLCKNPEENIQANCESKHISVEQEQHMTVAVQRQRSDGVSKLCPRDNAE